MRIWTKAAFQLGCGSLLALVAGCSREPERTNLVLITVDYPTR